MSLTEKFNKDFYLDHLVENGVEVEYWDLTNIYFQDFRLSGAIDKPYIKKIDSYSDLENYLTKEDLEDTVFIPAITFEARVLRLFKILSKYRVKMCFFGRGLCPSVQESLFRKLITNPANLVNVKKQFNFVLNKLALLSKKLKLIKEYDVVFAAGNAGVDLYKNASRIVKVNHFDYDEYLLSKNNRHRLIENRYCVFLDGFLPHHPDFAILNIKRIGHVRYYKTLNHFFDVIEEKYQVEVVISAHPKSDYKSNVFCNREVIKYKTDALVKDCQFAITTWSTSVSYPVLYKKPIVFISTDEIREKYSSINCDKLPALWAKFLNCSFYNIDSIRNKEDVAIRDVDSGRYEAYKYNFLTSKETENRLTKDIVLDYLKT